MVARRPALWTRIVESRAASALDDRTLAARSTQDVATLVAFVTAAYVVFYAMVGEQWAVPALIVNALALVVHLGVVVWARRGGQAGPAALSLAVVEVQLVHGVTVLGTSVELQTLFIAAGVVVLVLFTPEQVALRITFMASAAINVAVCELVITGATRGELSPDTIHALAAANILTSTALVFGLTTLTYARAHRAREEATAAAATARALANTDPLTGLSNRRPILEELDRAASSASFVVAIGDLDRFKALNDSFGHACGDVVLAHVARQLRQGVRATDAVGRWGGEEFILVLHDCTAEQALEVIETLRAGVGATRVPCTGHSHGATLSFGLADGDRGADVDEVMSRADAALYDAKTAGRNVSRVRPLTHQGAGRAAKEATHDAQLRAQAGA